MYHKYFVPYVFVIREIFSKAELVSRILFLILLIFSISHSVFAAELKDQFRFNYGYSKITAKNPSIAEDQVRIDEAFTPKQSIRHTHTFGLTYLYSDKVNFSVSLPYKSNTAIAVFNDRDPFSLLVKGFGDLKVSGRYKIYSENSENIFLELGMSLPTGSIDLVGDTPAGSNQPFPINFQPGSGTYDIQPNITYSNSNGSWSWSAQINSVIRLGMNKNDYALGDRYGFNAQVSRKIHDTISLSVQLDGIKFGDNSVVDINSLSAFGRRFLVGGERIDAGIGLNFSPTFSIFKGQTFQVQYRKPIYQRRDVPIDIKSRLIFSWRMSF